MIVDAYVYQVHEAELAHELIAKKLETEKAQRARISDAVAAAEVCSLPEPI